MEKADSIFINAHTGQNESVMKASRVLEVQCVVLGENTW